MLVVAGDSLLGLDLVRYDDAIDRDRLAWHAVYASDPSRFRTRIKRRRRPAIGGLGETLRNVAKNVNVA